MSSYLEKLEKKVHMITERSRLAHAVNNAMSSLKVIVYIKGSEEINNIDIIAQTRILLQERNFLQIIVEKYITLKSF